MERLFSEYQVEDTSQEKSCADILLLHMPDIGEDDDYGANNRTYAGDN